MKQKISQIIIFLCVAGAVVGLDQWTKAWAIRVLAGGDSITLIPGVLELTYVENRGMAFGLLQDGTVFFIVATAIVLALIVFLLIRLPKTKRMIPFLLIVAGVTGGAIGNLIDRVFRTFVVDFIYVSVIRFPVFNVADSFVTVGCILLAALLLFYYKDDDLKPILSFLKKKEEKSEE